MVLANGVMPDALLTTTSGGKRLYAPAAASYERTSAAFRARFGRPLAFGAGWTGYRPVEIQRLLFQQLGYPAAAYPGTSNHGLGLAFDAASGVNVYGSAEWRWMNTVGRTYGWSPLNERNLTFEPWHWVYDYGNDRHRPVLVPTSEPAPAPAPAPATLPEDTMKLVRDAATGNTYLWTPNSMVLLSGDEATVVKTVLAASPGAADLGAPQWAMFREVVNRVIIDTAKNLRGQGL